MIFRFVLVSFESNCMYVRVVYCIWDVCIGYSDRCRKVWWCIGYCDSNCSSESFKDWGEIVIVFLFYWGWLFIKFMNVVCFFVLFFRKKLEVFFFEIICKLKKVFIFFLDVCVFRVLIIIDFF